MILLALHAAERVASGINHYPEALKKKQAFMNHHESVGRNTEGAMIMARSSDFQVNRER
jgi:hypothetical protein